jgi:hypothetical protein
MLFQQEHTRPFRYFAVEGPRSPAEKQVDRVASSQEATGEGQHAPLDTTATEIIQ